MTFVKMKTTGSMKVNSDSTSISPRVDPQAENGEMGSMQSKSTTQAEAPKVSEGTENEKVKNRPLEISCEAIDSPECIVLGSPDPQKDMGNGEAHEKEGNEDTMEKENGAKTLPSEDKKDSIQVMDTTTDNSPSGKEQPQNPGLVDNATIAKTPLQSDQSLEEKKETENANETQLEDQTGKQSNAKTRDNGDSGNANDSPLVEIKAVEDKAVLKSTAEEKPNSDKKPESPCCSSSIPKCVVPENLDNDDDIICLEEMEAKDNKEKEEEKTKPSSETESDNDSDKPKIFLRNFAEIFEPDSDSDDDGLPFSAIPKGIASSYQKTISQLQDDSEDSSNSVVFLPKEPVIPRIQQIATYDTRLAGLKLDCTPGFTHVKKKPRGSIGKTAHKLSLYLTRKKTQITGPLITITPSQPTPLPLPSLVRPPSSLFASLPISVTPCRPPPPSVSQIRWQPTVSAQQPSAPLIRVSASNTRPLITSTPSYPTVPAPHSAPIRLNNWQNQVPVTALPRYYRPTPSSPQTPVQVQTQQVRPNTTPNYSNSPTLTTNLPNNLPQPGQVTQLIFDPVRGELMLCPTNQVPGQAQQPHIQQQQIRAQLHIPSQQPVQTQLQIQTQPQYIQNTRQQLVQPPSNLRLHNQSLIRPPQTLNTDRTNRGLEISMITSSPPRPPPQPLLMQRIATSLVRPPQASQFPRPPANPRGPRQPPPSLVIRRQPPPPPVVQQPISQFTTSTQYRNRAPTPVQRPPPPIVQIQPIAPRPISGAPIPPRHPSPRVTLLPQVQQIPSAKPPQVVPGTVGAGVTAGNQKPIPGTVEEADSDLHNKTFPSLVVHVKTILSSKPDRNAQTKARTELDANVKAVLVNTPAQFTEWLMRRGLLRLDHFCTIHKRQSFKLGMYSDVSRQPFSGGYVWSSECCPEKQLSVFSGSIFEGSKYPPGTVLKLVYHWSCQTPANNVLQWVKVSSLYLKNFFTLLRAVNIAWLHEMCPPLGGDKKYVEIGVITLGSSAETSRGVKNVNVEILGVFDPATKIIRMKVINSLQGQLFKEKSKGIHANEQGARAFQILWPLTHWVDKRSTLLVDGIIDKSLFHELGFRSIMQCSESSRAPITNANVMNYLRNLVPKMFSSTLSVLSKSIVQQFLDELSWREMYGQTVHQCFENILDHVGTMTKWDYGSENLISRLNKVYQNPFVDWSFTKQGRRCPLNTIPLTLRNEPGIKECIQHVVKDDQKILLSQVSQPPQQQVPPSAAISAISSTSKNSRNSSHNSTQKRKLAENTISANLAFYKSHAARNVKQIGLQQYYYGRRLVRNQVVSSDPTLPQNLKCPLCVRIFNNNTEIMRHLYMHVGSIMSRGNENAICPICLKDLPTGVSSTQHINQAHKMVDCPYPCRMCEDKFRTDDDMIYHHWDLHVPREAPFRCGLCPYASSFHCETVQHYHEKHGSSSNALCPICMKLLPAGTISLLKGIISHLQSHNSRRVKKCPRCVLSFPTENDLDAHMVNHLPVPQESEWSVFTPMMEEVVAMAVPPLSRTPLQLVPYSQLTASTSIQPAPKKPKVNTTKKKAPVQEAKSTLNVSFVFPLDTNEKFGGSKYKINAPLVEKNRAICAECNKDVTEPNHFIGRLNCSKCRYITACQRAMDLHHERNHQGKRKVARPGIKTKEVGMLPEPMVCKCGYSSANPYQLAHHLARCDKTTVYPRDYAERKKKALEEEEANQRQQDSIPPVPSAPANPTPAAASVPPPSFNSSFGSSPSTALDTIFNDHITTFDDMLSLEESMDTCLEPLTLPPIISSPESNSITMPQTPMPHVFDTEAPSTSTSTTSTAQPSNAGGGNLEWHADHWEIPLSGLIAKCTKPP